MIWALLASLIIAFFGGGGTEFDLAEPAEFRKTTRILKDVIEDSERLDTALEVISEIRDVEKATMKVLNKDIGALQKRKDWGFDVDFGLWEAGYDEAVSKARTGRDELTDLLGEWKSHMTEDEWARYLSEREGQNK